jgi:hypothetical protein
MLTRTVSIASLVLLLTSVSAPTFAPKLAAQSEKQAEKPADKYKGNTRLRIEVTGGDTNKPVSEASVYLRFANDKKSELDLKTNQEGIARSPEIPKGKILIQIVAPGWKTYGEYHDVAETEQTIQIHLVRPTTKWY